ncbi:MAG: glycine zipper 2TM domain-containing protein [Nevskiales bacterium]
MYKYAIIAGLSTALAVPGAGAYTDYSDYPDSYEHQTYAKVTRVEPIRVRRDISTPRQECWQEPVTTQRRHVEGPGTTARTVVGALIGAGLGYGLGRRHRDGDYLTAAGGLAGAAIGANSAARDTRVVNETEYVNQCRTVHETRTEERIDGYDVTYRYDGQTYTTRMPYDPGERIPVRVSVTPVN